MKVIGILVGDGKEVDYLVSELPMIKKVWYFVGATFNYKTGEATLFQEGVVNRYNSLLGKVVPYDYRSHTKTTFRFKQVNDPQTPFIIAGAIDDHELRGKFVSGTYAGKIDRHGVCNKVLSKEELDKMKKDKNEKLENKARGVSEEVAKRRKAMETLAPKMHHEGSPNKMHDGKKFEDEGFMDSHFKSGKPRK